MTQHKLSPQALQEIRHLASQWGKIVARHAFGNAGPGTDVDLDTMEKVAEDRLSRHFAERKGSLYRQKRSGAGRSGPDKRGVESQTRS